MKTEIKDGKLVITVDASAAAKKAAPLSRSGKSRLLASTGGFQSVEGDQDIKISLNVTVPL